MGQKEVSVAGPGEKEELVCPIRGGQELVLAGGARRVGKMAPTWRLKEWSRFTGAEAAKGQGLQGKGAVEVSCHWNRKSGDCALYAGEGPCPHLASAEGKHH